MEWKFKDEKGGVWQAGRTVMSPGGQRGEFPPLPIEVPGVGLNTIVFKCPGTRKGKTYKTRIRKENLNKLKGMDEKERNEELLRYLNIAKRGE